MYKIFEKVIKTDLKNHYQIKLFGYTLTEAILTMAIVGFAASLTIPSIVEKYQTKVWATASEVFEQKLEQALKVMNTQATLAGYSTTESFIQELSKHLKITKICKSTNIISCFEDRVYWGRNSAEVDTSNIKTSSELGQITWNTEVLGIQLANGNTGLIAYNPDCYQDPYSNQIKGTNCIAMIYDTSGYKKPNTEGKDLRSINVIALDGHFMCNTELADGTCLSEPFSPDPITKAECEELKAKGYGIRYCYYDSDCWAGAVKLCGGVDKLPSMVQLARIADMLYGISNTGARQNVYLGSNRLNYEKAAEIGITGNSEFSLWSKEEINSTDVYSRYYNSSNTIINGYDGGYGRSFSSKKVLCISE